MHHLGERHDLLLGIGPVAQVGDGSLLYDSGGGRIDRGRDLEAPVGEVARLVQRRYVHPVDPGERSQHIDASGTATRLPCANGFVDLAHHLLAIAEHHEVEEVRERLGVVGGMAACADQRVLGAPILRPNGYSREVEAVEHVGVDELGRQVERDEVELVGTAVGVHREERDVLAAEHLLEIRPRGVGPLRECIRPLVEDLVENLEALVGETDLVGVGIHQQPPDPVRSGCGNLGAELATDVARWLLDGGEVRLETSPDVDHGGIEGTGRLPQS